MTWLTFAVATAWSVTLPRALGQIEVISEHDRTADIDWPMYFQPDLGRIERIKTFDPRLKQVWTDALGRPDVETRRRAIDDIGEAHARGMEGLTGLTDKLVSILDQRGQHPLLILAAARSLIKMDAQSAAPSLLRHNERGGASGVIRASAVKAARGEAHGGIEIVLLTDPALARWGHQPAIALWLKRLADDKAPRPVRVSAISALRQVGAAGAVGDLTRLATDTKSPDPALRLLAARALGAIQTKGLEGVARPLMRGAVIDRLCAVALVRHHSGDAAQSLLKSLAVDDQPAVAAAALTRLLEIDPLLLEPLADDLMRNGDPNVRLLAAKGLVAQHSVRAIGVLGAHLDDHSPQVRRYVRDHFIVFDKDAALRDAVRRAAMSMLQTDKWRGLEQAAVILGRLDHEEAADRLVELIAHRRDEVRIASIIALRRLAVPRTLAAVLAHARKVTDAWEAEVMQARQEQSSTWRANLEADRQLSQMMQMFGLMRYMPAKGLMERYIPKDSGFWVDARAGAIWALGLLFENKPDARLTGGDSMADAFASRLSDTDPNNPEMISVRRMSAISLGRMNVTSGSGIKALEVFYDMEKQNLHVGGACRWALIRVTGKDLPPLPPREVRQTDWFIQPLRVQSP